jgi:hypothetical protein
MRELSAFGRRQRELRRLAKSNGHVLPRWSIWKSSGPGVFATALCSQCKHRIIVWEFDLSSSSFRMDEPCIRS